MKDRGDRSLSALYAWLQIKPGNFLPYGNSALESGLNDMLHNVFIM